MTFEEDRRVDAVAEAIAPSLYRFDRISPLPPNPSPAARAAAEDVLAVLRKRGDLPEPG